MTSSAVQTTAAAREQLTGDETTDSSNGSCGPTKTSTTPKTNFCLNFNQIDNKAINKSLDKSYIRITWKTIKEN